MTNTVISTNFWNKAHAVNTCVPTGIKTMGDEIFQIEDNQFAAGEVKHGMLFASCFMSKTSKDIDFSFEDAVREFEKSCTDCINAGWQEEWAINGLEACEKAKATFFN